MPNVFAALPVPAADGVGAWVDTSTMGPERNVTLDGGSFAGGLIIESSNDGQVSACAVSGLPVFTGGTSAPIDVVVAAQFMRVRRVGTFGGTGTPTVTIGAPPAAAGVFGAMAVPPADGAGAGIDLSAGGGINTFNVVGPFSGQLVIDVSTDAGATWSPAAVLGLPGVTTQGSSSTTIAGVVARARTRRISTIPGQPAPVVSVGSSSSSGGGGTAGSGTLKVDLVATANTGRTGLAAIDGVVPVAGITRILCTAETAPADNGIYVAAAGAWARAADFSTADQMIAGILISALKGTDFAGSLWMFATVGAIVVGVTALSFAFIGPSFGPDVRVPLPNAAGTLVQALRILTTLTSNVAGAETSQATFTAMVLGTPTVGLTVRGTSLLIPDSVIFASDLDTEFFHPGADNITVLNGGVTSMVFTLAGLTLNAGVGANLLWGAGAGFVTYQSPNGRTTMSPAAGQGAAQVGLGGGLAIGATHGFAAIATINAAGPPTGAPSADTGYANVVLTIPDRRLWSYLAGAWGPGVGL